MLTFGNNSALKGLSAWRWETEAAKKTISAAGLFDDRETAGRPKPGLIP